MATELRRTSIARLSTDGDNKGARVVAVRYFLDRPGADLTKASVRIYQNPPAACKASDVKAYLERQGLVPAGSVCEIYLDAFELSNQRIDRHIGHIHRSGGKGYTDDCLHYCLPGPPDDWNALLKELIVRSRDAESQRVGLASKAAAAPPIDRSVPMMLRHAAVPYSNAASSRSRSMR